MKEKRADISSESSDTHLLALARRGNEEAFIALFRRHQSPVFRFAMHMCGRRECAEEVTQEVFLQLLSPQTNYCESLGSLQAFLIGVARNQVRKQLRHNRMTTSGTDVEEVDSLPDAFELVSAEQKMAALRTAVLSLPPKYREAVVLCELEGMNVVSAAEQLGCAPGTIKSRLSRARSILRAKLQARERCFT